MRIFSHHLHPTTVALAILEFGLGGAAAYLGALVRYSGSVTAAAGSGPVVPRVLLFAAALSIGLTAMGLYQARQRWTAEAVLVRLALAVALAVIGLSVVYFAVPDLALGRGWLAASVPIGVLLLAVARLSFIRLVDDEIFRRRVLVWGAGDRAASLLKLRRRSDQRGFRIIA